MRLVTDPKPPQFRPRKAFNLKRLTGSAVVWGWAYNGFRLASGIVVLPIVLRVLSREDLGMHYVFVSLSALGTLMDFGLLNAIQRAVSFAMAGTKELRAFGIAGPEHTGGEPNYALLWRLLATTRMICRCLSLILLLLLGVGGTLFIQGQVGETSSPKLTWIAWATAAVAASFELTSVRWNVFLRGMNQIVISARIQAFVYGLRIVLAAVLLVIGGGLLSLPLAILVTNILLRYISRKYTLRFLSQGAHPSCSREEMMQLFRILWPNSWRLGVQFFSAYLTSSANALICSKVFGLAANAQYGVSVQIMTFIYAMTLVWTSVKWPEISRLRACGDLDAVRRLFWPRLWLQNLTFAFLAAACVPLAPMILQWLGTTKSVLPQPWLSLLAVLTFMEMQFSTWGSLIATANRMPFLRSTVLTNLGGLALIVLLILYSPFGTGSLVVGPLVAGSVFYYWYWPREGARTLDTTWLRFMFRPGKS